MTYRTLLGMLVGLLGLGGCHGPVASERLGLRPVTQHPPYRSRLAAYKLRGEPRPDAKPRTPRAGTTARRGRDDVNIPQPAVRRRPGRVRVSGRDLQPVHEWFSERNRQFILGDEVDIVASKEFFSQILTANAQVGMVRKAEKTERGDKLIALTFIGSTPSAANNPRVLIGDRGLTVTARNVLRIRLSSTQNAAQPVSIRITARGDAARGRRDEILQRGDVLGIHGALTWSRAQRKWVWGCR